MDCHLATFPTECLYQSACSKRIDALEMIGEYNESLFFLERLISVRLQYKTDKMEEPVNSELDITRGWNFYMHS